MRKNGMELKTAIAPVGRGYRIVDDGFDETRAG